KVTSPVWGSKLQSLRGAFQRGVSHLQSSGEFYEQPRESLRKLWRKVRTHPAPALEPPLLPQGVQSQFSCENSEGSCLDQKVVWIGGNRQRCCALAGKRGL